MATTTVIIRARDEADRIGRCLAALNAQRGVESPEVLVVDNASRDGTAEIARAAGAQVIPLARDAFTFGGALNLGAEHAAGEILVALSADAVPGDETWLARLLEAFEDPLTACASGELYRPDGTRLVEPVSQDGDELAQHPEWGYSNGAGAFRASLWRERPFRTDLPGCEDREWSAYWIRRGYVCVIDPGLQIAHDHTHDPLMSIYGRARRESAGFAMFLNQPQPTPAALIREWWSDTRFYDSKLKARLSHRRAARLLGAYAGRRWR